MKASEVLRSVNDFDELGDGGNQLPISSLTVNNRLIFVLYLSYICLVFVLYLSCICLVFVLYLSCICLVFVLYLSYICLVFVSGKGLLMI